MDIRVAALVYSLKMLDLTHVVDPEKSKMYGPRVAILKNELGQRLACVVESKKGFTVDVVKKMHIRTRDLGWCVRDERGRFVKRTTDSTLLIQ